MRIMNGYLFKMLLFSTVAVTIGLTFIIWLTQSLKLLELIIDGGAPIDMFGMMLLLTLPKFLEVVIPIALAVSCLFIYNKLTMDSEMVVMQSVGMSFGRLMLPALQLALFMGVVVFVLGGWLTPMANQKLDEQKNIIRSELTNVLIKPGVFNDMGRGITIYTEKRNSPVDFEHVFIHDSRRNKAQPISITAKRGRLDLSGPEPRVIVEDGIQQQLDPKSGMVNKLRFDSYAINLADLQKSGNPLPPEADERTMNNLLQNIQNNNLNKEQLMEFWGEVHTRISRSIYTVSFTLIAVVSLIVGAFNRRGQSKRIFFAIGILVTLQGLVLGLSNAAARSYFGMGGLYVAALIPGIVALLALRKQDNRIARVSIWRMLFSPERLI